MDKLIVSIIGTLLFAILLYVALQKDMVLGEEKIIALYAMYFIFQIVIILSEDSEEDFTGKLTGDLSNFDSFYDKYTKGEPDTYMSLRTTIEGTNYYLVFGSFTYNELPYRLSNSFQKRENADGPNVCKVSGDTTKYIVPVLMREDLMTTEYKNFLDKSSSDVMRAVEVKKALDAIKQKNMPEESHAEEALTAVEERDQRTSVEKVLRHRLYPRFMHHLKFTQHGFGDTMVNDPVKQKLIDKGLAKNQLSVKSDTGRFYRVNGVTKDQTVNVLDQVNKSPYLLTATNSFASNALLRKDAGRPMLNDKKFICSIQPSGAPDKYSNIYIETKPLTGVASETQPPVTLDGAVGKMDPLVNLYVMGDYRDTNGVRVTDKKFYFARLDTYIDPVTNTQTATPGFYYLGIIPTDYKECVTSKDLTTDPTCKGTLYADGVDYSDARKIDFEVYALKINRY